MLGCLDPACVFLSKLVTFLNELFARRIFGCKNHLRVHYNLRVVIGSQADAEALSYSLHVDVGVLFRIDIHAICQKHRFAVHHNSFQIVKVLRDLLLSLALHLEFFYFFRGGVR